MRSQLAWRARCMTCVLGWSGVAFGGLALLGTGTPAPAFSRQPDNAPAPRRGLLALPAGVDVTRDIEYGHASGKKLLLDVYRPTADAKPGGNAPGADPTEPKPRALPVIIWVHGGGWEGGTKNACPAAQLVPHGYAAVSVGYRFSQVAPYPAQIHDCKAAVRWVRANAKTYNFDPDRIGVWGASAGGHLVSLLGTSAGEPELEGDVGGNLEHSSRVHAVCNWFGPTDLVKLCRMAAGESAAEAGKPRDGYIVPPRPNAAPSPPASTTPSSPTDAASDPAEPSEKRSKRVPTPRPIEKLLGGKIETTLALAGLANPISFVDKSDAPFLIVHGDADTLVPIDQSQILLDALSAAGVDAQLHVVHGGGHGFWNDELLRLVREFFDKALAVKPADTGATAPAAKP